MTGCLNTVFWSNYGLLKSALRDSVDWSSWSDNFAVEISRPKPALFRFNGSYERECLQDRTTARMERLRLITNATAYIREHPELMQ
jgi:hypothetical protein